MFEDIKTLDDLNFKGKTVLLRLDLNSPIDPKTGEFIDDRRFWLHKETLLELVKKGAKIVILAHQGRPGDSDFTTLEKHAVRLSEIIGKRVTYVDSLFSSYAKEKVKAMKNGDLVMLENVRFYAEENENRPADAQTKTFVIKKLAGIGDIFVNDAFSVSHRSQPTVVGFTRLMPSCAGRLLEKELEALGKVTKNPKKPVTFILAGGKAADSFKIMQKALDGNIDYVLTGGIVSHIFLAAKGYNLGEPTMVYIKGKGLEPHIEIAKELLKKYEGKIVMPVDVALNENGERIEIPVSELPKNFPIYDIGSQTIDNYFRIIKGSGTIFAHATMGVIEDEKFAIGTQKIIMAIAGSGAFSVLGGGHTIASARELGVDKRISYISSGGGAAVTLLAGEKLPGVEALRSK
ncbi:MAG: phosphoglycerate kinase [Candidatus Altiarchaeales archaeon IMC4]|nr:MAG: phosphoglycerate kinase [Candidatus Altiarchaeales archaeon IMC4]